MIGESHEDTRSRRHASPVPRIGVLQAVVAGVLTGLLISLFRDLLPESRLLSIVLGSACALVLYLVVGAVLRTARRRRSGAGASD
ncbi:hypothetical protein [Kineococcus arenarius]|uniref:hypothetical protein n=1 Tax=unclassified Kineococcus TaxID=2621656 RepID=UPI003D7CF852